MSSRSEALRRGVAAGVFILAMAASAWVYKGPTPLAGAPATPVALSGPVDRAVARLAKAERPFAQVSFCDAIRSYLPDKAPWVADNPTMDKAPPRPVILCLEGENAFGAASSRAARDGLTWSRGIDGGRVIAFARDEAGFNAAMQQAGLSIPASALKPVASPLMASLRSNEPGVKHEAAVWSVPARREDNVTLYGPYVDLPPGRYRVRMRVTLQGQAAECREAARGFHPTMAATRDAGKDVVRPLQPMAAQADAGDACALTLTDSFTVPEGGARQVETPLHGPSTRAYTVDDYVLEPEAAAAQAR